DEIEARREQLDELGPRERGIVQVDAADVLALIRFERRAQQRRFARAGLSEQQRDRLGREQPVLERAERLAVFRGEKQGPRVRCQLERKVPEVEVVLIHRFRAESASFWRGSPPGQMWTGANPAIPPCARASPRRRRRNPLTKSFVMCDLTVIAESRMW